MDLWDTGESQAVAPWLFDMRSLGPTPQPQLFSLSERGSSFCSVEAPMIPFGHGGAMLWSYKSAQESLESAQDRAVTAIAAWRGLEVMRCPLRDRRTTMVRRV